MAIERILDGDLRGRVRDLLATEDILFEAARDLLKDRIKGVIQAKIEEDPDLKSELEDTIRYYYTTRIRTVYAELKVARRHPPGHPAPSRRPPGGRLPRAHRTLRA